MHALSTHTTNKIPFVLEYLVPALLSASVSLGVLFHALLEKQETLQ